MLRTPNFGRKSLNEIKEVLSGMGLHLGMDVDEWPPDNIEDLAKKFEDNFNQTGNPAPRKRLTRIGRRTKQKELEYTCVTQGAIAA